MSSPLRRVFVVFFGTIFDWSDMTGVFASCLWAFTLFVTMLITPAKTIIGNSQSFASSMGEGKTAVEKQKKSNAVEEIKQLSEQILSEVK